MKTIVVPTDFSGNATTALRYAVRLSNILHANLIILHCFHHENPGSLADKTEQQRREIIKERSVLLSKKIEKQLNETCRYLGLQVFGKTIILAEFDLLVVEKTVEIAGKYKADLIIMCTHGASGIEKYFLGSNASVMLSKSPVPVLVIPKNYRYKKIKRLLYLSDLEDWKYEIGKITRLAGQLQATIDLLYFAFSQEKLFSHKKELENILSKTTYPKMTATLEEADAKIPFANLLNNYLVNNKPDWIILFHKEQPVWQKLFSSSNTENISYALPAPLLSFNKRQTSGK